MASPSLAGAIVLCLLWKRCLHSSIFTSVNDRVIVLLRTGAQRAAAGGQARAIHASLRVHVHLPQLIQQVCATLTCAQGYCVGETFAAFTIGYLLSRFLQPKVHENMPLNFSRHCLYLASID